MNTNNIKQRVDTLKKFHKSHKTFDYEYRMLMLRRLEYSILKHEKDIYKALKDDLNKSHFEAHFTEIGIVIGELRHAIKNLRKWMTPKKIMPGLTQMPASVRLYSEPYGVVLIMSPWNYPFQLTMIPLIGAIAAGNCVVVKPSAYSHNTSEVIEKIINDAFNDRYITVVRGGREENQDLLKQKFDYIFFTGSPVVGKLVMQSAAENLTPVTLELGGKSPCIVDRSANIKKSAKRILFGKLLNLGQTCVSPDYLMVHEDIKDELVETIKKTYKKMVPNENYLKKALPKIINEKHYNRLKDYLSEGKVLFGGSYYDESRQISLTLIEDMAPDGPLMSEEIFGPILPIISWKDEEEITAFITERPKPLALYLFTKDRGLQNRIVKYVSYGGGCINDTLLHITASNQPFGGVGNSGMGAYHGYETFKTFSHHKNVMKKWWAFDLPVRYHPYRNITKKLPQVLFHG